MSPEYAWQSWITKGGNKNREIEKRRGLGIEPKSHKRPELWGGTSKLNVGMTNEIRRKQKDRSPGSQHNIVGYVES